MEIISVVVPSYNHQPYIEQCLRSILAQTYSSLEVIIVDDGSTDNSLDIIYRTVARCPHKVKVIPQNNQGSHAAINNAIQVCSGEWIAIINSDDYYHPDRIELLLKATKDSHSEFGFSKVVFVDHKSREISRKNFYARSLANKQDGIRQFPTVGFASLQSNVSISTGNFLFSRNLYERVGHFANFRYCHDWDFLLRSLYFTEPCYLDIPLYYYRLHKNNSFLQVEKLTDYECPLLLSYLNRVHEIFPPNPYAPCKYNWPYYFDYFLQKSGVIKNAIELSGILRG